jgi:hypothetical protein
MLIKKRSKMILIDTIERSNKKKSLWKNIMILCGRSSLNSFSTMRAGKDYFRGKKIITKKMGRDYLI